MSRNPDTEIAVGVQAAAHRALKGRECDGDVLLPDEDFRREHPSGATRRTDSRYDQQGLPFAFVNAIRLIGRIPRRRKCVR
jgi:hypothetical protein